MQKIIIDSSNKVRFDRTMEFHISKSSRDRYKFDKDLFSITGNVIIPNLYQARVLAQNINSVDNLGVKGSDIFAMGLIDEILHFIVAQHRENKSLNIFGSIINSLKESIGPDELNNVLYNFVVEFPGSTIIAGKENPKDFLLGINSNGVTNREITIEEILLLHIANINPAFSPFNMLFSDENLRKKTKYDNAIEILKKGLSQIEAMDLGQGKTGKSLYDILIEPFMKHPNSLRDQLNYMMKHWGVFLSGFNLRILNAMDSIKEENKPGVFGFGPPECKIQNYANMENDIENFTTDKEWMPNAILMAKSTMVWLDQLSKKYGRIIDTLCKIPDQELDILANRGFNGLWLIGLWNRSEASKKIKQRCGNPDAVASAYSLYNYDINLGLGGWSGIENLRERCAARGIRLASDMVPNHTGIDSEWVRSKPHYFIQCNNPPFPTYTFNSENLSDDPNIGIYLEDHYYSKEDAAVVFKRVDFNSGDIRYIYHGNDGTMMPWNDTAQIDFLNPEAREAVIQDIIHVAKNFPIIRFDAAMTLAKKHIQRLWFPLPGSGGDIASRSDYAISQEDFDRAIPNEFWREVVDRLATECPDTLLLAEAFWMLEGYFVRTLGMHRVYNSAFMNMLKMEENFKYRESIMNTINFDPDILKRYVNFMNNPDEDTAYAQFGSGDKYFGVCTLMVTLPGLPMFGHGQIEGFREKYGMEYAKAYWDEKEDVGLVRGHEHIIFPLLKKRELFSEVENFNFYPFVNNGNVDHNVFAYTNNYHGEKSLVLFNNSPNSTAGWVNVSEEKLQKNSSDRSLARTKLFDAFGLANCGEHFCILTNLRDGLNYIRSSKQLAEGGMFFSLNAYETQVFTEIYQVKDSSEGLYAKLHHNLAGSGVKDIHFEFKKLELGELYEKLKDFFLLKTISKKIVNTFLEYINCKPIRFGFFRFKWNPVYFHGKLIKKITAELKKDVYTQWLIGSFYPESQILEFYLAVLDTKKLKIKDLFSDQRIKDAIGVNKYDNVQWFNKEMFISTIYNISKVRGRIRTRPRRCIKLMEKSGFNYQSLLDLL